MSARVLLIGPDERAAIALLKAHAATRIFDVKAVTEAAGDMPAFRVMMRRFSLPLPHGYVVTYTHERQPDPRLGVIQHISVSVDAPGKYPSTEAVEMILAAFGMAPIKDSLKVWPEDVEPGVGAVNIVQRLPAPS
jgi:hypothetical protein